MDWKNFFKPNFFKIFIFFIVGFLLAFSRGPITNFLSISKLLKITNYHAHIIITLITISIISYLLSSLIDFILRKKDYKFFNSNFLNILFSTFVFSFFIFAFKTYGIFNPLYKWFSDIQILVLILLFSYIISCFFLHRGYISARNIYVLKSFYKSPKYYFKPTLLKVFITLIFIPCSNYLLSMFTHYSPFWYYHYGECMQCVGCGCSPSYWIINYPFLLAAIPIIYLISCFVDYKVNMGGYNKKRILIAFSFLILLFSILVYLNYVNQNKYIDSIEKYPLPYPSTPPSRDDPLQIYSINTEIINNQKRSISVAFMNNDIKEGNYTLKILNSEGDICVETNIIICDGITFTYYIVEVHLKPDELTYWRIAISPNIKSLKEQIINVFSVNIINKETGKIISKDFTLKISP